ncbi:hypothetical protein K3495_g10612 [Podosphaera aphanis]|nr:hypothetical protein K3495_g10612 [Podosphaera aphanis]
MGKESERERLQVLEASIKPTDIAIKTDLRAEYALLCKTPYGKYRQGYFDRWSGFEQRMRSNPIFATGESEAVYSLIASLQPLYPTTAIFRRNKVNDKINEGEDAKLKDEIRAWTTLLQQEGVERFPTNIKSTGAEKTALSASFQGKNQSLNSGNQDGRPTCPCGLTHWPSQCYYLNPERRRKPNWKMNKETAKKVKLFLQKNPKFAAEVDEAIKKWEESVLRARKNIAGNAESMEVARTQENQSESEGDSFAGTCLAAGSTSSSCSLFCAVVLDSGTNVHIINEKLESRIVSRRNATSQDVVNAGNLTLQCREVVNAEIKLCYKGKIKTLTLIDALYIPDFMANLVSLPRLNKIGLHHDTTDPSILFKIKENKRIPVAEMSESKTGHFILEDFSDKELVSATASSSKPRKVKVKTAADWHKILAHPGVKAIEALPNNTNGIEIDTSETISTVDCDTCLLSKAKAIISRRSDKNREVHLENESQKMAVVSWGITEMTEAIDGSKVLSHFYYDAEAFHVVYPSKTKAQAVALFKAHFTRMISLYGAKTIFLRSDDEATIGEAAEKILSSFGIVRLRSCPDTPAQNGAGEISGKVIIQAARCLRIEAQLPKNLWPWICGSAAYLLNRTPTKKLSYHTPFEKITGKLPFLGHLHRIGSKAFALDKNLPKRDKMEARAHIGYLVGFEGTNIYQIWIPHFKGKKKNVIRTRDVVFKNELHKPLEDISLGQGLSENQHALQIQRLELPEAEILHDHQDPYIASSIPIWKQQKKRMGNSGTSESIPYPTPSPTASREQTIEPDDQVSDFFEDTLESTDQGPETETYFKAFMATLELKSSKKEATKSVPRIHRDKLPPPPTEFKDLDSHEFGSQFRHASMLELNALSQKTFEIISSYDGYRLPLKWVWTYKFDANGFLIKFKACLCVRRDLQLPSISETYAATLAMKTFRAIMAITCAFGLETRQYDLVNAFCNAHLSNPVHCAMPPGFEYLGSALKLHRALYGLKESPRLWYQTLKNCLSKFGFEEIPDIDCLMKGRNMLIIFYVDDLILIYWPSDKLIADEFDLHLSSIFETTFLGEAKWFLGIQMIRDKKVKKLWLSQESYCSKIGVKFEITGREKYPATPLPSSSTFIENKEQATKSQIKGYQIKVGSIGHAAVSTRPDIAKAHSILAQFNQNPSERHLEMADHLISYVYGSRKLCLSFDGNKDPWQVFCDASYADHKDRKSSQGLLFKMFGGSVEWKATKQKTVTTSTTEAELLALSVIGSHCYWWDRFFSLSFRTGMIPAIKCDNQQACRLANGDSEILPTKLRHVDIHQHWVRQEVKSGKMVVQWVPTTEQEADGLTKLLSRQKFETSGLGSKGYSPGGLVYPGKKSRKVEKIRTIEEEEKYSIHQDYLSFNSFFYPKTDADFPSSSRLPDGRLNLDLRIQQSAAPLTEQEKMVKLIWPEAKLAGDAKHIGETSSKNKVTIKSDLRLIVGDSSVSTKLREIQTLLLTALIPYNAWPQRLALEMSGDFERVRLWIGQSKSALFSPVTEFTRLSPLPNETMKELAWRIRAKYYEVPAEDQERRFCKATLIEHIKEYLPQIWSMIRVESSHANTSEIAEILVARMEEYAKWNNPTPHKQPFHSQFQSMMTFSDPRTHDQNVLNTTDPAYIVAPSFDRDTPNPSGHEVVFKGRLYYRSFPNSMPSKSNPNDKKRNASTNNRVHLVDSTNENTYPHPDHTASLVGEGYDSDLTQLISDMDNESDQIITE